MPICTSLFLTILVIWIVLAMFDWLQCHSSNYKCLTDVEDSAEHITRWFFICSAVPSIHFELTLTLVNPKLCSFADGLKNVMIE